VTGGQIVAMVVMGLFIILAFYVYMRNKH